MGWRGNVRLDIKKKNEKKIRFWKKIKIAKTGHFPKTTIFQHCEPFKVYIWGKII